MIEKIIILILLIAGLFGVLWLLLITFIFGNTYSGLIIKRKNADVKGATYKIIFWIKLIVPLGFFYFFSDFRFLY